MVPAPARTTRSSPPLTARTTWRCPSSRRTGAPSIASPSCPTVPQRTPSRARRTMLVSVSGFQGEGAPMARYQGPPCCVTAWGVGRPPHSCSHANLLHATICLPGEGCPVRKGRWAAFPPPRKSQRSTDTIFFLYFAAIGRTRPTLRREVAAPPAPSRLLILLSSHVLDGVVGGGLVQRLAPALSRVHWVWSWQWCQWSNKPVVLQLSHSGLPVASLLGITKVLAC